MTAAAQKTAQVSNHATRICLTGLVQGVGMRPLIARLARQMNLSGQVKNNPEGVQITLYSNTSIARHFVERLQDQLPAHTRVDDVRIEAVSVSETETLNSGFVIGPAVVVEDDIAAGTSFAQVEIPPDVAACQRCIEEIKNPEDDRYRYALNSCADCGPRFSMLSALPYERHNTAMQSYPLCQQCQNAYESLHDRRFHAQGFACHRCGPEMRLERMDGRAFSQEQFSALDAADAAAALVKQGEVLAVQGVGGFHLVCDATHSQAVQQIRTIKRRPAKPFALMARDVGILHEYCELSTAETEELHSPAAPIVLLKRKPEAQTSLPHVADGLGELGFMVPYTPLHHLLMQRLERPVVMTSANASGRPQCLSAEQLRSELPQATDWLLLHDRPILNRVDDSVVRHGESGRQVLRLGRGLAPQTLSLPEGFAKAPAILACGGHLKNSLCLLKDGRAVLSPCIGDLDSLSMRQAGQEMLHVLQTLHRFTPVQVVTDCHPDYGNRQLAEKMAEMTDQPLQEVQHHHAHAAACFVDNGRPLNAAPILAITLDGMGLSTDGELWGGEFLLADYQQSQRLACLRPVSLAGGDAAARQPWRILYAWIEQAIGWEKLQTRYGALGLVSALATMPLQQIDAVMKSGLQAPTTTSVGRLFDAVAAALQLPAGVPMQDGQSYEGQAAMQLETLASKIDKPEVGYTFSIEEDETVFRLDPSPMWNQLFMDLGNSLPRDVVAAKFHYGLATGIVNLADRLYASTADWQERTVALSGGVFQNALLRLWVTEALHAKNFTVLNHETVPCNDGGLALGQAAIAAARLLNETTQLQKQRGKT